MEWTPVSKALPPEGEIVLVTVWEDRSYGKNTDIHYYVDLATFCKDAYFEEGSFMTSNDWDEGQPCKITAWMLLPEPYKEEQK